MIEGDKVVIGGMKTVSCPSFDVLLEICKSFVKE